MVDQSGKAKQFEGFDFNDYQFCDTSAWTWNVGAGPVAAPNDIQIYIAGTQANAAVLALAMLAVPNPAAGLPATSIGPQYPWPYHGVPGPVALPAFALNGLINPLNVAPVQKTLIRVVNNDVEVYFLNMRMATYLYAALLVNPIFPVDGLPLAQGGPGTALIPRWPLPVPVLLQADVGLYEFERKWIWLLYVRAVAGDDADLHVYMEG